MIEITFFSGNTHTDKEYNGDGAAIMAALDMEAHIKNGGHCMATYGNKSVMVTSISQLGFTGE